MGNRDNTSKLEAINRAIRNGDREPTDEDREILRAAHVEADQPLCTDSEGE